MPCRDYYDDHPEAYYGPMMKSKDEEISKLRKQISFAESALCEALKSLEHVSSTATKQSDWYDWINYGDAGITKTELVSWHTAHKELDRKHRAALERKIAKETEELRLKEVAKNARSKLTAEERKVLGIK